MKKQKVEQKIIEEEEEEHGETQQKQCRPK